jgi:hypothetical protein
VLFDSIIGFTSGDTVEDYTRQIGAMGMVIQPLDNDDILPAEMFILLEEPRR